MYRDLEQCPPSQYAAARDDAKTVSGERALGSLVYAEDSGGYTS